MEDSEEFVIKKRIDEIDFEMLAILKTKEEGGIFYWKRYSILERMKLKEQKKLDVAARKKIRQALGERFAAERRLRMREKSRERRLKKTAEQRKLKAAARAMKESLKNALKMERMKKRMLKKQRRTKKGTEAPEQ